MDGRIKYFWNAHDGVFVGLVDAEGSLKYYTQVGLEARIIAHEKAGMETVVEARALSGIRQIAATIRLPKIGG